MNKKKLNNKGFAISTVLYGLLVVMILLFSIIMSIMSFNRKSSKDFVEGITSELEEGLGIKINSNSNLIIDSIDKKLYQNEKYKLTYKFSVKGEVKFIDYCGFSSVYGGITLGSYKDNNLSCNAFSAPHYNAETNSTEFEFNKDIYTGNITKAENMFYIVMSKNWFSPALPSDVIVDINGLSIVEETPKYKIEDVEYTTKTSCIDNSPTATISYSINKPGKIIKIDDIENKFTYIVSDYNGAPIAIDSQNYQIKSFELSSSTKKYNVKVELQNFCKTCSFSNPDSSYPISMYTSVKNVENSNNDGNYSLGNGYKTYNFSLYSDKYNCHVFR